MNVYKRTLRVALCLAILSAAAHAQANKAAAPPSQSRMPAAPSKDALEKVLSQMDATAANFKSATADFIWDQYQKVVNDHDIQKGSVFFRRQSKEVEMAADIAEPDKKYVLFSGGKVRVYQPKIDQVTEYNAGKNRAEFESFLVLGFGARGHDLQKSFDVQYAGTETVDGIHAAKLELAPKAQKVKNIFSRIVLWIDPARGVSVQQQLFEQASGNYRLAKYSNIKLNEKLPDNVFKLKTTPRTKVMNPQG
jgi:outer membrane lipoprotein-sorting protein